MTTLKFNVTGPKRKELAGLISRFTGNECRYLGAPSFAYAVGGFRVDKDGSVQTDWEPGSEELKALAEMLYDNGFVSDYDEARGYDLEVSTPRELFTDAQLENLKAIEGQFHAFIQNKTKLNVAVTATGAYGSTIVSVTTTINGTTYTEASFTTEPLSKSGTQTVTMVVKDSRNRTSTLNRTYEVMAYKSPTVNIASVFRCNSSGALSHNGTYVAIRMKANITSLDEGNDAAITIQSKRKTAENYTTLRSIAGIYVFNDTVICGGSLSSQYAYDIRVAVSDYFETVYAYADITTADTIFSIRNNGLGMAIGKISEQNKFEMGWEAVFHEDVEFEGDVSFSSLNWLRDLIYPVGSIRMTVDPTNAETFLGGTWELWGEGRVPVGVDPEDRDLCDPEMEGGEKAVTLTTANMPSHNHSLTSGTATAAEAEAHTHQAAAGTYKVGSGSGSNYKYLTNGGSSDPATTGSGGGHTHTITLSGNTGSKGSGTAHSNMQPYITCFFYKRTA